MWRFIVGYCTFSMCSIHTCMLHAHVVVVRKAMLDTHKFMLPDDRRQYLMLLTGVTQECGASQP
jgi:hypothetical protein